MSVAKLGSMLQPARKVLLPFLLLSAACGGSATPLGPPSTTPDAGDALLPRTSFLLPDDGTPNDNGPIGPFCCSGTTLVVRDRANQPVGYVYFFGWHGQAYNTSSTSSAAPDLSLLVSGVAADADAASPEVTGEIDFDGSEMKPGAARTTKVGRLLYTATLEKVTTQQISGQTYFDMGSLTVRIDVATE